MFGYWSAIRAQELCSRGIINKQGRGIFVLSITIRVLKSEVIDYTLREGAAI